MNNNFMNLQTFPQISYRPPTSNPPFYKLWDMLYPSNISSQAQIPKTFSKPAVSNKKPKKFSCKYPIMIENEAEFQVSRKIIGPKGCNMKKIIDLTLNEYQFQTLDSFNDAKLIKLRLRGKGSGFMEGSKNSESKENLHLCVSARSQELLNLACKYTERLLMEIYKDYELFCMEKGQDPPVLQVKKVTVRIRQ